MGSSYSDLYLYFKRKKDENGEPNNKATNNGNNKTYTVKVSKSNYQGCVNFEKVTHTIEFTPASEGLKHNIILNDSCDKDKGKGKIIFGYYYPSDLEEVLKELHVYYSVLAPNDPLVVSFVTRGDQIYNFTYSGLLSTRWVRAYSISYYSLSESLTTKLLTKEFRNLRKNKKIQFKTGKEVEQVSGNKQVLENDKIYRYIFFPNGNTSVLGSDCLNNINDKTSLPECPDSSKSSEHSQPASETSSSPEPAKSETQAKSPTNYDNKIDPYYLDFVNGHYYDGVILYFVKNGNNQGNANNNNQAGSSQRGNNANGKGNSEKYDHNMAVLLELIVNCKPKTHIKRKDKQGNYWAEEKVKYDDDTKLIKELKEFQKLAEANDSTTFILEKKEKYVGVSDVKKEGGDKITYTKYTHTVTATNIKTNLLFRKSETKIGKHETSTFKTQTLDVFFLKIGDKEQDWPFILMFTFQNESQSGGASSGSAATAPQQQQQPPQAPSGNGAGAAAAAAPNNKSCKKCYFSSENYDFTKWSELEADKKAEPSEKEKEKTQETKDPGEELQKKLDARLDKIEQFGKCTNDINILRSIAYQVLIGKDDPDTTKAAAPEPVEGRPDLKIFKEKIYGTSLKVVLGSVAAGLVVLGIISAIIYGIYWYNTTIKLLT